MKLSYFLLGMAILFFSVLHMQTELLNLKIQNEGEIVNVEIVDIPRSCPGKGKWYMKVKYHNKIFEKRIPKNFCETHALGNVIQVHYLVGVDKVILLDEGFKGELMAIGIFIFVALYITYLSLTYNGKIKPKQSTDKRKLPRKK